MAQKAKTEETQAKPEAAWVDVISGSEVHREHEPTRLLRVSGLAPPGDLGVTSYWLGGLAKASSKRAQVLRPTGRFSTLRYAGRDECCLRCVAPGP